MHRHTHTPTHPHSHPQMALVSEWAELLWRLNWLICLLLTVAQRNNNFNTWVPASMECVNEIVYYFFSRFTSFKQLFFFFFGLLQFESVSYRLLVDSTVKVNDFFRRFFHHFVFLLFLFSSFLLRHTICARWVWVCGRRWKASVSDFIVRAHNSNSL